MTQEQVRHSTCRLCSGPITRNDINDINDVWYHNTPNLGAVHGVRPHFASPAERVAS